MKRTSMKPGAVALKRTAFARAQRIEVREVTKLGRRMKSKELAVTAAEKILWSRLAALGCIACMKDGWCNTHVSIHHCDGRTKPGCHGRVLPLCAPHHQQDDTDPAGRIAIHPNKARFERRYGTQAELMAMCAHLLRITKTSDIAASPLFVEIEVA